MCYCFICLRPLLRVVHREARTKMDSYCGTTTSKSSYIEITLRNLKGNHSTSISASKNMSTPVDKNDNRSHFIRLDESVDVDVSPRSVEETV